MTLSLRARLAAISTLVFGLLLAMFSIVSYAVLARWFDQDASQRLTQLADGLHGYLQFDDETATVAFDANDNDQAAFVHEATRYFQVYDASTGRLLAESPGFAPLGLQLTKAEVQAYRAALRNFDIQTEYGRMRVANSLGTAPGGRVYLLQVGVSLATMDATLRRYRDMLLWRVPVALLLAVLASWWLSRYALRPLASVAAAAGAIDVNTLRTRLPIRGIDDELDRVATAFNETLGRLEHAVGEMRQFSAALAHELRTPLAALRGELELAQRMPGPTEMHRDAFASQIEEIDRLTRLIDQILTLSRAQSGQIRLAFEPIDLADLACAIVDQLEVVAEARTIALSCVRTQAVVVSGDAGWLRRLLLNLIDNALKFTMADGRVVVRVSRDASRARIEVEDTGIGLSPDDAQHVFERFFRADRSRTSSIEGAGLGLSLVQWIATQHGGRVTVASRLAEGTTFVVDLPLSVH